MNESKAREFFSSYYEGSLDAGLRQAFESKLHTDAEIQAEYRAFERTMDELGGLKHVEVEIPFDLNDKIQARLDRHVFEQKRAQPAPWFSFLRPLAFAGLAGAAIVGAVLTINSRNGNVGVADPMGLGAGPSVQTASTPDGKFVLQLNGQEDASQTVKIVDLGTNTDLGQPVTIEPGQSADIELTNSNKDTKFVRVDRTGEVQPLFVAVPSTQVARTGDKDQTLRGAAMRLAEKFDAPVVLLAKDPSKALPINEVTATDSLTAAKEAFGPDFAVELKGDVIWVEEH